LHKRDEWIRIGDMHNRIEASYINSLKRMERKDED
jgi:hypothetical protein